MSLSPNTQAVLLLTAHFSKVQSGAAKPLTPKEWGRFALWLKEKSLTPEQLMTGCLKEHLGGWSDEAVTLERIESLMDRGVAFGLAMDKWLRAGLWVMTRSDPDYPRRLKKRLGTDAPAVLFGCGSKRLLNQGGLAVVGSRNAAEEDLDYAYDLGALAANNGYSIVSGGAKGIDEASMLGALEVEGTVVGILANSLLRTCSSVKYRDYLMEDNLALISPFQPDAGFNVGNAMQRNKYIYCLSDAAVVVHSGKKGGTWNGAEENLKKKWVSLWVKQTTDEMAGNAAMVEDGAEWISGVLKDIDFRTLLPSDVQTTVPERDLPGKAVREAKPDVRASTEKLPVESPESYDSFLVKVEVLCSDSPRLGDELKKALNLKRDQFYAWLKQAVADKKIKKSTKPVRYQWVTKPERDLLGKAVRETKPDVRTSTEKLPVESPESYDSFLVKVEVLCSDSPRPGDELREALNLKRNQFYAWLKQAVADKKIEKSPPPVRYQWVTKPERDLPDKAVREAKLDLGTSIEELPAESPESYDSFLVKVEVLCSDSPRPGDELREALNLKRNQFYAWLKQAVADKKIEKSPKPVRYQWVTKPERDLPDTSVREAKLDLGTSIEELPVESPESYDSFLVKVEVLCSDSPRPGDELKEALNLKRDQFYAWLKQAVEDKKIEKLTKPVRYQWVTKRQDTLPI